MLLPRNRHRVDPATGRIRVASRTVPQGRDGTGGRADGRAAERTPANGIGIHTNDSSRMGHESTPRQNHVATTPSVHGTNLDSQKLPALISSHSEPAEMHDYGPASHRCSGGQARHVDPCIGRAATDLTPPRAGRDLAWPKPPVGNTTGRDLPFACVGIAYSGELPDGRRPLPAHTEGVRRDVRPADRLRFPTYSSRGTGPIRKYTNTFDFPMMER